jgi:hypothetical protein
MLKLGLCLYLRKSAFICGWFWVCSSLSAFALCRYRVHKG